MFEWRSKRLLHTPQTVVYTGATVWTTRCGTVGAEEGTVTLSDEVKLKTNSPSSQPDNLNASGYDMVLAQAMYAIVGAVSLEQGGAAANRITKDRILAHIGLRPQVEEASPHLRL